MLVYQRLITNHKSLPPLNLNTPYMIKTPHTFGSNGWMIGWISQDRLQQTMSQKSVMEEVLEVSLLGGSHWGTDDGGY